MASTSIYQHDDGQDVLDLIDRQFAFTPEKLVTITKGFLEEMERGLNEYGKPMAMMFVPVHHGPKSFLILHPPTVPPSFVVSLMAQKLGTCSTLCDCFRLRRTDTTLSTFLALDLGGTNL